MHAKSYQLEFNRIFFQKLSKDTQNLEYSINSSYEHIIGKFFNLIETKCPHLCKINRIKIIEQNQTVQNKDEKKIDKIIENIEIATLKLKIDDQEINKHPKSLLKQKINTTNEKKQVVKEDKANCKYKNESDNILKKIKDDEMLIKLHPPLASSSILLYPTENNDLKHSSPKLKKTLNQEQLDVVTQSGKVKQMVEMVEARMKDLTTNSIKHTPLVTSKTIKTSNQFVKNPTLVKEKVGPRLSNKFKKKTSSTIDQRKLRNSISNQEQKRKSIRKLNAFLRELNDGQEDLLIKQNPVVKNEPEKATINTVNTILNKITSHPPIVANLKPIKANLNILQDKTQTKPLHPTVQSLYNVKTSEKSKFTKFLERNTPCKMSKMDLIAKEKKELERLNEREKLLHEKAEISKKKREEKMKKIAEIKLKNEIELKKRQEEINMVKRTETFEIKAKQVESEKKIEETDKSNVAVQQTKSQNHQYESVNNVVKNSPFVHKIELKPNVINNLKENKNAIPNIYSSPKPKNLQPIKHEPKTPAVSSNQAKHPANVLKQLDQNHVQETVSIKKESEYENYEINDLNSNDETDDEEEPNKPIPAWAKNPSFTKTARNQSYKFINFTKLFRASAQNEINLDNIFKIKRKKFYERSSSANWNSSPIWNSSGIHGNESFRQLHK